MGTVEAIILGIIQGLTEFLPISSSGHLVITQHFLHIDPNMLDEAILFDLVLHLGTVVAVLYCYWGDVVGLLSKSEKKQDDPETISKRLPKIILVMFVISIFGTAIIGLPFETVLKQAFVNPRWAAIGLLLTAIILSLSLLAKGGRKITGIKYLDALIIGLGQGVAAFPGISRSGTTIVTAMLLGFEAKEAARYSFLLSAPTILLVSAKQFLDVLGGEGMSVPVASYVTGFLFSLIFGVLAIKILIKILSFSRIAFFAIYCLIAGTVTLAVIN